MFKTFTFAKMQPGFSRDEFFDRWCRHTQNYEVEGQPEIEFHRLMMIDGDGPFVGIAETHWKDAASLDWVIRKFDTPSGEVHRKELESFIDMANSPTFVVTHEATISASGVFELLVSPEAARSE